MSYRQAPSDSSSTNKIRLSLQPASAWIAILGLVFFTALLILAGAGTILNLAFPAGAFAVGLLLYFRYPILYIGFSWWMWFLTPLVRRLADYRSGFTNPSPILLAPYLVIFVTLFSLWKYLPKTYRQGGLPFVLGFVGIFYAYLVGLIKGSPLLATLALLEWLVPVLFGFHLFVNWRNYPSYRQNIERTFVWGVLIMGVYGIIQYLVAPEWDRFWLTNTELISAGSPEPLGIRVWSTMHGPGVFASFLMAGLLLLLNKRGAFSNSVSVAGYLTFLLTAVRGVWLMWFFGLFTHMSSLKSKLQIRIIIIIMVLALGVVPLTTIEPFSENIISRLGTPSNLENDSSAKGRINLYHTEIGSAFTNVLGNGIEKQSVLDSGIIDIFSSLGWFGGIFYLGGILLIFLKLSQDTGVCLDPFFSIARAISFSSFFGIVFGRQQLGAPGVIWWGFLGIAMAASKYYHHQLNSASRK